MGGFFYAYAQANQKLPPHRHFFKIFGYSGFFGCSKILDITMGFGALAIIVPIVSKILDITMG